MGMKVNNKTWTWESKYYFVTHADGFGNTDILEKLTELGYTGDVIIMDRWSISTKTI